MHTNVEANELAKFEAMAEHWWDPIGTCRPLHELNPIRLQFITDRCELTRKTVIDIGCGGGILAESMAMRGAIVTGIDISPAVLKVAQQHALKSNLASLHYIETTAEDYANTHAESFDILTCMELLEHVPDPYSILAAAAKLIKPNGHLFFSTLNRTPKSYVFAVVGAEYVLNLLPRGTHQYEKFIRPAELDTGLRNVGLELKELSGIQYNPFLHKATTTPDLSINYISHAIATPKL